MPLNANDWNILKVLWPAGQATKAQLAEVFGISENELTYLISPIEPPGTGSTNFVFCGPCNQRTQRCPDNGLVM